MAVVVVVEVLVLQVAKSQVAAVVVVRRAKVVEETPIQRRKRNPKYPKPIVMWVFLRIYNSWFHVTYVPNTLTTRSQNANVVPPENVDDRPPLRQQDEGVEGGERLPESAKIQIVKKRIYPRMKKMRRSQSLAAIKAR